MKENTKILEKTIVCLEKRYAEERLEPGMKSDRSFSTEPDLSTALYALYPFDLAGPDAN